MRVFIVRHAQSENNALLSPELGQPFEAIGPEFNQERVDTVCEFNEMFHHGSEWEV